MNFCFIAVENLLSMLSKIVLKESKFNVLMNGHSIWDAESVHTTHTATQAMVTILATSTTANITMAISTVRETNLPEILESIEKAQKK